MIDVDRMTRYFRVHRRGDSASGRTLFRRDYEIVRAVDGITFTIGQGETVGLLGRNGAGKTTILKCLSGLLLPTTGRVTVLGSDPHRRSRAFLSNLAFVMGNRNHLYWDLPAIDTFEVNRVIYDISRQSYTRVLNEMVELLGLGPLLGIPVRKLSLGQRMRCEIAAALLHSPKVVFLDEPTIGLDVQTQIAVRKFLREYAARGGATIILTSHQMADIAALATRVIIIADGRMAFDGNLAMLASSNSLSRTIQMRLEYPVDMADVAALGEIEEVDGCFATIRVERERTRACTAEALSRLPVVDLSINEPSVEEILHSMLSDAENHAPGIGHLQ